MPCTLPEERPPGHCLKKQDGGARHAWPLGVVVADGQPVYVTHYVRCSASYTRIRYFRVRWFPSADIYAGFACIATQSTALHPALYAEGILGNVRTRRPNSRGFLVAAGLLVAASRKR